MTDDAGRSGGDERIEASDQANPWARSGGRGVDRAGRGGAGRAGRGVERQALDLQRGEPLSAGGRRSAPRQRRREPMRLEDWPSRPRILVTNDDGVESRGLLALKEALDEIGETFVVAPETNQSAVGHTKTLMRPLRVRERLLADGSTAWSVDGSPTDAVSLAFLGFFGHDFDLVASGINYGANLGDDITYSGTVSAAMEGVINGAPAFAVSQEYYEHPDFDLAGRVSAVVARNILEQGLNPGELLNVNVPALLEEADAEVELTRLGKRVYQDQLIQRLDPRGIPYYWIGGPPPSGLAVPGTDFHAVVHGRIAVTPIQLDLTARALLRRLHSWQWDVPPASDAHGAARAPGAGPAASASSGAARSAASAAPGGPVAAAAEEAIGEETMEDRR